MLLEELKIGDKFYCGYETSQYEKTTEFSVNGELYNCVRIRDMRPCYHNPAIAIVVPARTFVELSEGQRFHYDGYDYVKVNCTANRYVTYNVINLDTNKIGYFNDCAIINK